MNGHAIITGGSSGIGLALARRLCASGMDLTLIARGASRLCAAATALESLRMRDDQRVLTVCADVADKQQVTASISMAVTQLGVPELLVTSAGMARPGYFDELPDGIFEASMRVNYFGTLHAVQAVAPAMRAQRRGRIVMMSSAAGLLGIFGYAAYSPTKFALRGLAEALRGEFARDDVGISVVYPPDTDTPQLHEENKTKPAETRRISANAATWQADDVAQLIIKGIAAGRFAITPGFETTVLYRLGSVLSPLLAWQFDRLVRHMGVKPPPDVASQSNQ
jgi:3-dehydrosphinganine reductase